MECRLAEAEVDIQPKVAGEEVVLAVNSSNKRAISLLHLTPDHPRISHAGARI